MLAAGAVNADDSFKLKQSAMLGKDSGSNSLFQTALSIVSTVMGCGIVSVPYSYATAGFTIGLSVQVVVVCALFVSVHYYLEAKRIMNCETTFSGLAYACLGSSSGIVLNLLIAIAIFGILTLYMILFSRIAISIFGNDEDEGGFFNSKMFYVIILGLVQLPIITRRRLQELKFTTYALVGGVVFLLLILTTRLIQNGAYVEPAHPNEAVHVEASNETEALKFEDLLDSTNIAVASYGFVINLFPIYCDMQPSA